MLIYFIFGKVRLLTAPESVLLEHLNFSDLRDETKMGEVLPIVKGGVFRIKHENDDNF